MKALSPLLNIGHCTVTILRMPGLPAQPTIGTILQPTSLQGLVGCIFSILSYTQDVTRAYWILKFQRILCMRHFPLALAILFALYTRILDFVS